MVEAARTLLPANRTPRETAISEAVADWYDVGERARVLDTLWDPLTCPAVVLPRLAWAVGLPLWSDEWDEDKRRRTIAAWPAISRTLGTREGYAACLAIVGAELVDMLVPPQGLYLGPELTKAQWDAWIAGLPQIRVQTGSQEGVAPAPSLYLDDGFLDDGFVTLDLAPELYGRKAVLRRGGVDTPLKTFAVASTDTTRSATDYEAVSLDGSCPDGLILDHDYLDHCFIDAARSPPRIVTYALDRSYVHEDSTLHLSILDPGLEPIDTRYERLSDTGDAGLSLFLDHDYLDDGFFGPDQAGELLADVMYLNDPSVSVPVVDALSWIGFSRIQHPLFVTELMIRAERPARAGEIFLDDGFLDDGFLLDDDLSRIEAAMDAVAAAAIGRDKLLVTFETTRPRTFGDGLPLDGSVAFASRLPAAL